MTLNVNYDHIYFDRYSVDKKKEAEFILTKIFKNEIIIENGKITIDDTVDLKNIQRVVKHEFFLLLEEEKEEKEAVSILRKAEAYIKLNYKNESLTVEAICDHCGTTRNILDRQLGAAFGQSVTEYVKRLRVEAAAKMLAEGFTTEEIAVRCGFGSMKTMVRAFKTISGKTPGAYRAGCLDSRSVK